MASVERNTVDQRAACRSSRSLSTIAWNWDTVGKSDPPVNSFGLRLLTQRPQVRSGLLPNATAPKGTRKTVKPLPSIATIASPNYIADGDQRTGFLAETKVHLPSLGSTFCILRAHCDILKGNECAFAPEGLTFLCTQVCAADQRGSKLCRWIFFCP